MFGTDPKKICMKFWTWRRIRMDTSWTQRRTNIIMLNEVSEIGKIRLKTEDGCVLRHEEEFYYTLLQ